MSEREQDRKAELAWEAVVASESVLTKKGWFCHGFALGYDAAIQAERERCAKIAEDDDNPHRSVAIADAIRRGGEHEHNE